MITVFGYPIQLPPQLSFLANVWGSFLATLIALFLLAVLARLLLTPGLRSIARRTQTEVDDIIIAIVSRPIIALIVVFGALNSLEVFGLSPDVIRLIEHTANSILTLIVAYLIWRILRDVVVYYGERIAERTESRVDDVVVPLLNLFGPLIILLTVMGVILSIWGIDIGSMLVGAGVIGLVLGLALQDTLSNIFSGISLLVDAPFRKGDLIVLGSGPICRVERIGVRATQLYHLDEHSYIYAPNKDLASAQINNITKPTVDLRLTIDVGVSYNADLPQVERVLQEIAYAHPNLLATEMETKIGLLDARIATLADAVQAAKHTQARARLVSEMALNEKILAFEEKLYQMMQAIQGRESGGLAPSEIKEIRAQFLEPLAEPKRAMQTALTEWSALGDPWCDAEETRAMQLHWQRQNERLDAKWTMLVRAITNPRDDQSLRLDDMTQAFAQWLRTEYKLITPPWKNPSVNFVGFGASSIDLRLAFYIDDIRLEHAKRKTRVVRELGQTIHARFQHEGIEIPFPQLDLWVKKGIAESIVIEQ